MDRGHARADTAREECDADHIGGDICEDMQNHAETTAPGIAFAVSR